MCGSIELSAANIHVVARERALASAGISASEPSAMCITMAPDSNSTLSPSS